MYHTVCVIIHVAQKTDLVFDLEVSSSFSGFKTAAQL